MALSAVAVRIGTGAIVFCNSQLEQKSHYWSGCVTVAFWHRLPLAFGFSVPCCCANSAVWRVFSRCLAFLFRIFLWKRLKSVLSLLWWLMSWILFKGATLDSILLFHTTLCQDSCAISITINHHNKNHNLLYPDAPCMEYLPTFGSFLWLMLVNIPAPWSIWDRSPKWFPKKVLPLSPLTSTAYWAARLAESAPPPA